MTRTDAIRDAVEVILEQQRHHLDRLDTLRAVQVDVKLKPGTEEVRTVIFRTETEAVAS